VIFGVTLRITITSEGFAGTSLDAIVRMNYVDVAVLYKESLNEMKDGRQQLMLGPLTYSYQRL